MPVTSSNLTPFVTDRLLRNCQKVEAGYADGHTMLDPGMIGAVQAISESTDVIGDLIAFHSQAQQAQASGEMKLDLDLGFRETMLDRLVKVAQRHGEESEDPDHEVGDLLDLVRPMWTLLSAQQQRDFLADPRVVSMVECAGMVAEGGDELSLLTPSKVGELLDDEWQSACAMFGLDTSFQYPTDAVVEIVNAYRFDPYREDDGPIAELPHDGVSR